MKKFLTLVCSVMILVIALLPTLALSVSAEERLTTDKTTYVEGEDILVTAIGGGNDWVGIYKKGEKVGSVNDGGVTSIRWYYVAKAGNASGTPKSIFTSEYIERQDMAGLPAGEYTIFLLENDGYNILAQVDITITTAPVFEHTLSTDKTEYTEGEDILVTATGKNADWIGIYKKGESVTDTVSIRWYYVAKDGTESGDTKNLFDASVAINTEREAEAGLPAGEYSIFLLENDGYNILKQVDITVCAKQTEATPPDTGVNDSMFLLVGAVLVSSVVLVAVSTKRAKCHH